jgi:hypothetical protein
VTGEDGAWGEAPEVTSPTMPVTADAVPVTADAVPVTAGVVWLAVVVWAAGCDPLAGPWRARVVLWATLLTVLVTGEDVAWVGWLVVGALAVTASTALETVLAAAAVTVDAGVVNAGVVDAGALLLAVVWPAGAGWAVDGAPLVADPLEETRVL